MVTKSKRRLRDFALSAGNGRGGIVVTKWRDCGYQILGALGNIGSCRACTWSDVQKK